MVLRDNSDAGRIPEENSPGSSSHERVAVRRPDCRGEEGASQAMKEFDKPAHAILKKGGSQPMTEFDKPADEGGFTSNDGF